MGQIIIYKDSSQVDFYHLGNEVWTTIWKHVSPTQAISGYRGHVKTLYRQVYWG